MTTPAHELACEPDHVACGGGSSDAKGAVGGLAAAPLQPRWTVRRPRLRPRRGSRPLGWGSAWCPAARRQSLPRGHRSSPCDQRRHGELEGRRTAPPRSLPRRRGATAATSTGGPEEARLGDPLGDACEEQQEPGPREADQDQQRSQEAEDGQEDLTEERRGHGLKTPQDAGAGGNEAREVTAESPSTAHPATHACPSRRARGTSPHSSRACRQRAPLQPRSPASPL